MQAILAPTAAILQVQPFCSQFNKEIPLTIEVYDENHDSSISHITIDNPTFVGYEITCLTLEFIRYSAWKYKTEIEKHPILNEIIKLELEFKRLSEKYKTGISELRNSIIDLKKTD